MNNKWKIKYKNGMTYFEFYLTIDECPVGFFVRNDSKFGKIRQNICDKFNSGDLEYLLYNMDHLITDDDLITDYYGSNITVIILK